MSVRARRISALVLLSALFLALAGGGQEAKRYATTLSYQPVGDGAFVSVPLQFQDGASGNFEIDTGSDVNFITGSLAAKLGQPSEVYTDPQGVPYQLGNNQSLRAVRPQFHLGGFPFKVPLIVMPPEMALPDARLEGILGTQMLGQFAVLFDFLKHQVTLYYPGNFTKADLKLAGMEGAATLPKSNPAKFSFTIPLRLNNAAQTEVTVDTGSNHTFVPRSLIEKLHLQPVGEPITKRAAAFGNITVRRAKVSELAIGPLVLRDQEVEYSDQTVAGLPYQLGMDILTRYRLLIDYPAGKLYLKPAAPPSPRAASLR